MFSWHDFYTGLDLVNIDKDEMLLHLTSGLSVIGHVESVTHSFLRFKTNEGLSLKIALSQIVFVRKDLESF